MSQKPPAGDSAGASITRPHPSRMGEFLPLWNKRNAHIEAASAARARRTVLAAEEGTPAERLQELDDIAAMHDSEVNACTAQMEPLSEPAQ